MLYKKFEAVTKEKNLLTPSDKVLLGLSGGSDSVALFHLLIKLQKNMDFFLAIGHLDHCIRGSKAARDMKFVRDLSKKANVPFFTEKINVPALAKEEKLSIEDAARQARFNFFRQQCELNGFNKIMLAHTQDDQAETIILKLIRGTGLKGLAGMAELRPLTSKIQIIRPLLSFSKKELIGFCKKNGFKWREDHTNQQINYTRNKLRQMIIPKLKEINPNLNSTFQKMSEVITKEDKYIEEKAKDIFPKIVQKSTADGIRLDTKALLAYPLPLQRRVVRLAMEKVQGHLTDVYLGYIENFLDNCLTTIKLDSKGKLHVSKERL